jgi:hypothetical protein
MRKPNQKAKVKNYLGWWYHHPMVTATAQAFSNIAFIK